MVLIGIVVLLLALVVVLAVMVAPRPDPRPATAPTPSNGGGLARSDGWPAGSVWWLPFLYQCPADHRAAGTGMQGRPTAQHPTETSGTTKPAAPGREGGLRR
jgi:hypothetical protein